jgi:hypothetical protein
MTDETAAPKTKSEPKEFFTWRSAGGVMGAATIVTTVSGTLSQAFGWLYPAWFPLLLAFLVVALGDGYLRRRHLRQWPRRAILWFANACLVYMTAIGATKAVTPSSGGDEDEKGTIEKAHARATAGSTESVDSPVKAEPGNGSDGPEAVARETRSGGSRRRPAGSAGVVDNGGTATKGTFSVPTHVGATADPSEDSPGSRAKRAPVPKVARRGFSRLGDVSFF